MLQNSISGVLYLLKLVSSAHKFFWLLGCFFYLAYFETGFLQKVQYYIWIQQKVIQFLANFSFFAILDYLYPGLKPMFSAYGTSLGKFLLNFFMEWLE